MERLSLSALSYTVSLLLLLSSVERWREERDWEKVRERMALACGEMDRCHVLVDLEEAFQDCF